MRSVVSQGGPGLLLFDEPSASLDPTAEHGVSPYRSYYLLFKPSIVYRSI